MCIRDRELTSTILKELIEKIEVYGSIKINGKKRIQKIWIFYHLIEKIDIPNKNAKKAKTA